MENIRKSSTDGYTQIIEIQDDRVKPDKNNDSETDSTIPDDNIYYMRTYRYQYRLIERKGNSLLHYAMIFGNADIVNYLLDNKAGEFELYDPKHISSY